MITSTYCPFFGGIPSKSHRLMETGIACVEEAQARSPTAHSQIVFS
jgi:hypothetical protein